MNDTIPIDITELINIIEDYIGKVDYDQCKRWLKAEVSVVNDIEDIANLYQNSIQ